MTEEAMSIDEILAILDRFEASGSEELRIERGSFKLIVSRHGDPEIRGGSVPGETGQPGPGDGAPSGPLTGTAEGLPSSRPQSETEPTNLDQGRQLHSVKAPMVGVFYRAPSPGAAPFVEPEAFVDETDIVCLIEVMKLMNSVRAGVSGRVVEVFVEDGALVEYGQELLAIDTTDG